MVKMLIQSFPPSQETTLGGNTEYYLLVHYYNALLGLAYIFSSNISWCFWTHSLVFSQIGSQLHDSTDTFPCYVSSAYMSELLTPSPALVKEKDRLRDKPKQKDFLRIKLKKKKKKKAKSGKKGRLAFCMCHPAAFPLSLPHSEHGSAPEHKDSIHSSCCCGRGSCVGVVLHLLLASLYWPASLYETNQIALAPLFLHLEIIACFYPPI